MNHALRLAMVGLVLVNLGFVQITDAANWTWLGPLFGLTIGAPWLVKMTRFFWYRALWNVAVLGTFGILVHRFTGVGVQHLLGDGLLLAALCQVHLLNNLTEKQRPDLLFFNSFLIAVVTSYLSVDLPYLTLFLAYVPIAIFGLQMLSLTNSRAVVTGSLVGRVAWQTVRRSVVVLGLTVTAFFFFPRDFERKGFAGEAFTFKPPRGLMETDFSEQVELDRSGEVRRSDKIVMRVKVNDGAAHGVPSYWRGATHDLYRDGRWHRAMGLRGLARDEWRGARGQFYRRAGNGNVSVTVVLENRDSKRLFLPDNAARIRMVAPADRMLLRPDLDATIHCNWGSFAPGRIEYLAALDGGYREPGGSPRTRRYDAWLHVNRREVPRRMQATARDLRRRLGDDAPQFQIVEVMRQYLANGYGYLAPGENGGATSLAQFFEERRGAHCEIFATALVLMLRCENIPCRLVTGYRSVEWDTEQRVLTVRKRDAHAWVEVLDPKAGWMTVDPTPALEMLADDTDSVWSAFKSWFGSIWSSITGFNDGARGEAMVWLRELPARLLRYAWVLLLVAGFFVGRRWRRRRRIPVAVIEYAAVLRSLKLTRGEQETPRELLARADLDKDARGRLESATRRHEELRYAVQ